MGPSWPHLHVRSRRFPGIGRLHHCLRVPPGLTLGKRVFVGAGPRATAFELNSVRILSFDFCQHIISTLHVKFRWGIVKNKLFFYSSLCERHLRYWFFIISKRDSDPADWLPPNVIFHCEYVRSWVLVKGHWDLSMDDREKNAVDSLLEQCESSM